MTGQLSFDWPPRIAMGDDSFFVSKANARAYALVSDPALWPDGKLALTGPSGAGKTHLARLFVDRSGAISLPAAAIDPAAPLPDRPLVIEDGEVLSGPAAEEWLFHAHNHLREAGLPLLLTGCTPPGRWPIGLPDLASRLSATTCVAIAPPDDRLLEAVLLKQFQDRQIAPTPRALVTLMRHLDRSFDAVRRAVEQLDREALAQRREVSDTLVREVLDIPPAKPR